jgi:hypothetical protein
MYKTNIMKKWIDFVNENLTIQEPIVIKSKKNDLFFIKIHFDDKGRVDKIENKWNVKIPDWYGLNVNEIEIKNWIDKKEPDFYIQKELNESQTHLAFNDEIKTKLSELLQKTVWKKVDKIEDRVDELMYIHRNYIKLAKDKLSADEIAKSLFEYEKNNLKI